MQTRALNSLARVLHKCVLKDAVDRVSVTGHPDLKDSLPQIEEIANRIADRPVLDHCCVYFPLYY